jgi:hypothetical protein
MIRRQLGGDGQALLAIQLASHDLCGEQQRQLSWREVTAFLRPI